MTSGANTKSLCFKTTADAGIAPAPPDIELCSLLFLSHVSYSISSSFIEETCSYRLFLGFFAPKMEIFPENVLTSASLKVSVRY